MIAFLSLLVALLAVVFGPLVSWVIAHQGNAVTARKAWIREFRDNVAALLSAYDAFVVFSQTYSSEVLAQQQELARHNDAQRLPYHKIRLLITAHDPSHAGFIQVVEKMLGSSTDKNALRRNEVVDAAASIMRQECALIAEAPCIWPAIMKAVRP